jgi:hypothetical protein
MTTTITIETHDWPVAVGISVDRSATAPLHVVHGWSTETIYVASHSKRQFHISSKTNLTVSELPKDATDLTSHFSIGASEPSVPTTEEGN